MASWEEKFTGQQKSGSKESNAPDSPDAHKSPFSSNAPSSRMQERALPLFFDQMRRHLDDIWSNILLEAKERPDAIMFCGSTSGEGCSFLSFNLALFLALAHSMKTVYVDTAIDVPDHIPCIPSLYSRPGLCSFFSGASPLEPLVAATEYDNLYVLPSGAQQAKGNVTKNILTGERMEQLVGFCRKNFDIAIFDGQPVSSRPTSIEFAKKIPCVIMICRQGSSRREVSMVSIDKLRKNGIAVTGVILNDRQFPIPPGLYNILK